MAATSTVPQHLQHCNFVPITPRQGVITLFGYGIRVQVERGHLVREDGIGSDRRQARFSRVGHGLRRLVVIGSEGMVTLASLRWLADQKAAFVMLDRDGSVLTVSGPVGPSDARLRRAQSLAHQSDVAVRIGCELIFQKLQEQERVLREVLKDSVSVHVVASARSQLDDTKTVRAVRQLESQAAQAYWSTWHRLPVNFPVSDLRRAPEHWRTFGTRKSPLTGSPRLAVNPANAMLNYMYALLESEARLAASAVGLDPGIGFLHVDTDARDSLACDLMEPVRPKVDAFLLGWIRTQPLRREWFFEQRDGSCRLMASFASRLSESAPAWRQHVAPIAEWVSHMLWATFKHGRKWMSAPTPLTQSKRRDAKGKPHLPSLSLPEPPHLCRTCGRNATRGYERCGSCRAAIATEKLVKAAEKGRMLSHLPDATAKRIAGRRRHAAAIRAWKSTDQPEWLTEEVYRRDIQSKLASVKLPTLMAAMGISKPYAINIRSGKRVPHPRHWKALAQLTGVSKH
jgi:CRISPR-associated endonuclease Cas1